MASNILWGCCDSGSKNETFRCCSTCKRAYHINCLHAGDRKDFSPFTDCKELTTNGHFPLCR